MPIGRSAPRLARIELAARHAVIVLILLAAMQATYAARGLYADGAYYLWKVLESQTFFLFPSRGITQLVTQLPVVAAIRLGVTDVGMLARLQSFGTAGFPMIVWAVTFVVLLRHQLFWPFVAIFAVTFLNSGFFSVGEYNCASAFVALSAAILLRGHLKPWSCAVLVLSAVMLPLSYETLAFLGPGLAFLAFLRLGPLATNWTHKRWGPVRSCLQFSCTSRPLP